VSNQISCRNDYAQLGVWYDALYCAHTVQSSQSRNIRDEMKEFWSLLQEINLSLMASEQSS